MKGISERLWKLIGILIGFYGNWYFSLLTKLGETQNLALDLIWAVSALSLFMFCAEIVHWERAVKSIKGIEIRLSLILALVHLTTIFLLSYIIKGWTLFSWTGMALWALISLNETKMFYMMKF